MNNDIEKINVIEKKELNITKLYVSKRDILRYMKETYKRKYRLTHHKALNFLTTCTGLIILFGLVGIISGFVIFGLLRGILWTILVIILCIVLMMISDNVYNSKMNKLSTSINLGDHLHVLHNFIRRKSRNKECEYITYDNNIFNNHKVKFSDPEVRDMFFSNFKQHEILNKLMDKDNVKDVNINHWDDQRVFLKSMVELLPEEHQILKDVINSYLNYEKFCKFRITDIDTKGSLLYLKPVKESLLKDEESYCEYTLPINDVETFKYYIGQVITIDILKEYNTSDIIPVLDVKFKFEGCKLVPIAQADRITYDFDKTFEYSITIPYMLATISNNNRGKIIGTGKNVAKFYMDKDMISSIVFTIDDKEYSIRDILIMIL